MGIDYETMCIDHETLNNVRRLAIALFVRIQDEYTLKRLASVLDYMPEQLLTDVLDLDRYTSVKVQADREAIE